MSMRNFVIVMVGLLFTAASVSITYACDEECKPGEIYSDAQELCVPAPKPTS
jgi:hypothetical protein